MGRSNAIEHYDYIVIGAGPSGCASAALLKRAGNSVLVLEGKTPESRKVCGGGISIAAMNAFKKMEFPVDRIRKAGNRITDYYSYEEGCLFRHVLSPREEAYGLDRKITDGLLRSYIESDLGVRITYGYKVSKISKVDGVFVVGHYHTDKLVLACGASMPPKGTGLAIIPQNERPVGVSMVVKSLKRDAHYFMFDYSESYRGTYGWVFSLGGGLFNVGLWLKSTMKESIWTEFESFVDRQSSAWVGKSYEVIAQPRSFPFGVKSNWLNVPDGMIAVGDAKCGSNPQTGEGLSRAINSAISAFGGDKNNADD